MERMNQTQALIQHVLPPLFCHADTENINCVEKTLCPSVTQSFDFEAKTFVST
jgi:hypothetical protein